METEYRPKVSETGTQSAIKSSVRFFVTSRQALSTIVLVQQAVSRHSFYCSDLGSVLGQKLVSFSS